MWEEVYRHPPTTKRVAESIIIKGIETHAIYRSDARDYMIIEMIIEIVHIHSRVKTYFGWSVSINRYAIIACSPDI